MGRHDHCDESPRSAWFAATAILAAPLLIGAQQQTSKSRAGWPCGARLDPSYFRVAEGTGGHLMLLAPDELSDSAALLTALGDHPQTLLRLAGSITPGLHEFRVPVDSSVESIVFSISVQCLQVADVARPSGGPVSTSDGVADLSSFRSQRMVIVTRPEPGVWSLRVGGSGVSAVVVQARSAIGISQVEFASAPSTTFTAVPSGGVENAVRIRVNGPVVDVRASLVSGVLVPMVDLPLTLGDTPGLYVSRFTPGADGFRLLIEGKDASGFAFQRMYGPLFTAMR